MHAAIARYHFAYDSEIFLEAFMQYSAYYLKNFKCPQGFQYSFIWSFVNDWLF